MSTKNKKVSTSYLRPPVVTIMGHVDHGKTTLLDTIRKTKVAATEHGGITQHISTYQINFQGKKITFIDTPGHAAFLKMRSRGIEITDLAVLVVAANDGVQPQTKECINLIKKAKIPFLVAINKIDLPEASVEMVKNQLAKEEVLVEGYGGNVVCCEISAKTNKGVNELLEMILLLYQMHPSKANLNAELEAVVIESRLDVNKGPVCIALIKNGTLALGDQVAAEHIFGKIKALKNYLGEQITKAEPSDPVEILGFKIVPKIGSKILKTTKGKACVKEEAPTLKKDTSEQKITRERVKIILKADTAGTLEAIQLSLPLEVEVIKAEVGEVSKSDVLFAQSIKGTILAFNVPIPTDTMKLARTELIKIKTYNIIYELLEDLEKKVLKILEPTIDEEVLGEAVVIAKFLMKGQHIAGCRIKKGKINKKDPLHLSRDGKIIADCRIKSFQKERLEVSEAKTGSEIGLALSPNLDFKIGDVILSYSKKI